ncbi:hypothetical protein L2E82_41939 [Cichorium intybus]|uniref:Uncharacterized protein n=1 Tax=Cichorium intybus TaxID=13427 RepID=A0ACB8ZM51_CICIN|nr:hypothetical protein L2E82_41939 [Cichorium intybus]
MHQITSLLAETIVAFQISIIPSFLGNYNRFPPSLQNSERYRRIFFLHFEFADHVNLQYVSKQYVNA